MLQKLKRMADMCSNFEPASPKQIESILNKQLEIDFNYKQRVYPKIIAPSLFKLIKGLASSKGNLDLVLMGKCPSRLLYL